MKNFITYGLFLIVILGVGLIECSSNNQKTTDSVGSYSNQNQNREELIITSESETITIPIERIPTIRTYLEEYTTSSSERKTEIERMRVNPLPNPNATYAVISYSCGIKLCDNVLVNYKNDQVTSIPLPQSSFFQEALFTVDNKYLAIKFGKNEGSTVSRSSLVIIDTVEIKNAEFQNNSEIINKITNGNFTVPIRNLHWENDTTLKVTIPDIKDYSFKTIEKWINEESETKTKEVKITLGSIPNG
ncbi:hypothetical protein A616_00295 [Brevibacillus brevis X23]|nr:hypothetical protein A616_00295 [Brevibacillus brevis X23]